MCLGIPGQVVGVEPGGEFARVDLAGIVRQINLGIMDEPIEVGDYVLIHSGFALERMSADQAREALQVFQDGSMTGRPEGAER